MLYPDDNDLKLLNTQQEKIALLEKAGIEHLIVHPFTREFSRLTSLEFIRDILVKKINTKKLVIGYDHHFGRNREGTFDHLKEFGHVHGFEVEEISAQDVNDIKVSSTKIRNALLAGDIKVANRYLGHDFTLSGTVVHGEKRGKDIHFPTANIFIKQKFKIIPANGVYAVIVKHEDNLYNGMLNIGNRPTFVNSSFSIEVNIFDFTKEIYNDWVQVIFKDRIRDELRFDSAGELKDQLANDKLKSLELLASRPAV